MDITYFWSQWEQLYGLTSVWILSCIFSWHQGLSWMDIIFRHNESRYIVSSVWILSWIFSWHQVFLECRSSLVTMRAVMWFVTSVVSFMRFQLVPGLSWMQIIFGHNESSYVVCHQCGFFHAFSAGTRSFLNADHFWSQWEQLCGLSPVWFLSCVFSWYQGLCQAWLDLSIVIHGSVFKYTELDVSSTSNTLLLQWSPIHTFYWCEQRQHHLCVIRGPGHVHMYANQSDLKLFYAKTLKFD